MRSRSEPGYKAIKFIKNCIAYSITSEWKAVENSKLGKGINLLSIYIQ